MVFFFFHCYTSGVATCIFIVRLLGSILLFIAQTMLIPIIPYMYQGAIVVGKDVCLIHVVVQMPTPSIDFY